MKVMLKNNKGVALVTSLMLTLISLGIIMALFYIITQSIKISAASKRYASAKEAAYGGGALMAFDVLAIAWKNYSSSAGVASSLVSQYGNVNLSVSASDKCLRQKMSSAPANWSACSSGQKSLDLSSIKSSPDLSFLLKGASVSQHYKVFAKIVDTSTGNTDSGGAVSTEDPEGLIKASGSAYSREGAGGIPVMHVPYNYRIEVQSEKESNPMEKSNVTVLYAY